MCMVKSIVNAYEWCVKGRIEAKDSLQNISLVDFKRWIDKFMYDLPIIIENLEDIKEIDNLIKIVEENIYVDKKYIIIKTKI